MIIDISNPECDILQLFQDFKIHRKDPRSGLRGESTLFTAWSVAWWFLNFNPLNTTEREDDRVHAECKKLVTAWKMADLVYEDPISEGDYYYDPRHC